MRTIIPTDAVGDVELICDNPGAWTFDVSLKIEKGLEYLNLSLNAPSEAVPPCFTVSFAIPQQGIRHLWEINSTVRFPLRPNWTAKRRTSIASGMPLFAFLGDDDRNRLTVASDEVFRELSYTMGIREEGCMIVGSLTWFSAAEAPRSSYSTTLCFDRRDIFWAETVTEASLWMRKSAGCVAGTVPEAAYEPLYSTWYQYHQDVFAGPIERECAIASPLGMKTVIVDDGWQTDNTRRGYSWCGDWQVTQRRFPDMPGHVRRVKDMGMKYMLWYAVPFVGNHSAAFNRFKECFLYTERAPFDSKDDLTGVLDPRFPQVREYLIGLYVTAAREWGLDGFKLDFIDRFRLGRRKDPALKDNYAGRDVKTVPEGVNLLMCAVRDSLTRLNPDVLLEFRQGYVGPSITAYGNMFRVSDCPGDACQNRVGICNLRIGAPGIAIHSDMLEWHPSESASEVARNIQSSIFGVIQYSVELEKLPKEHLDVVKCWLDFSRRHRSALLKGWIKPHHPEAGYPLVEAGDGSETVKAVYHDGTVVPVASGQGPVYLINASSSGDVAVDFEREPGKISVYDYAGRKVQSCKAFNGLGRLPIPSGGWAEIR